MCNNYVDLTTKAIMSITQSYNLHKSAIENDY